MKKILLLILFVGVLASPAYAFNPVQVCSGAVAGGAAPCAGGTTAGMGTMDPNNDTAVTGCNDVFVFETFTASSSTDGNANTITMKWSYVDSGNYVNCGVYSVGGGNVTTLLADGDNTDQGDESDPQTIVCTLDSTVCLVDGTTYVFG